jgi:hypothetical protein
MSRPLILALSLICALSSHALELVGRELFLPIAGRTPGAAGTVWETDLFITNLSPEYAKLAVRVEFHTGGAKESFNIDVLSNQTVVLEDFVRARFGRDQGVGTIRITAEPSNAQLTAHALVHNTSGAEPLGQTIPALPIASLRGTSVITGLLVTDGHRSNVGVANPHDHEVEVLVELGRTDRTLTLAPYAFVQLDASPAAPLNYPVRVFASHPVYAYGSVIRDGNGDPQFVLPVETRTSDRFIVPPACASPAPLRFATAPSPGYIVVFHEGLDVEAVTTELAARLKFEPLSVFAATGIGFYAELSPAQLAALQCEPVVKYIEQNSFGVGPGVRTGGGR